MNKGYLLPALALGLSLANAPHGAWAETLQDALSQAYKTNPVLQGQRLQQDALDETYVQAKAGWRPSVSVALESQYARAPNSLQFNEGSSSINAGSAAVTLTQPLYTGGRTTWAVRAAEASVLAGREDLRSVEAQVLLSVIQGYMDVLRDQQILTIRQADMATLERQVAESSAKFNLGQVTKTDVAQTQAQLEGARASLAASQAQLEISRAEYEAAVGAKPGSLVDPVRLPHLPASVDDAFDLAEASNPSLLQSQLKERSSRAEIAVAKSAYRPTVALQGSYGYIGPIAPLAEREYAQDATAAVTLTLPIVTGGVTASQVRQATAQNGSDRIAIEAVRRQVIQNVSQAWNQFLAGKVGVTAGEAQVVAAQTALEGEQAEYGFGLRSTLDVLISDINLRAAQLSLAESRHDAFLAQALVLAVSGLLEMKTLLPTEPTYDPQRNFDKVKNAAAPPWEGVIKVVDQIGAPQGGGGSP